MRVKGMVSGVVALAVLGMTAPAQASTPGSRSDGLKARRTVQLTRERLAKVEVDKKGRMTVPLDGGARAELTIDPRAQKLAERALAKHGTPVAAAVMISVADGKVLALAGRSTQDERTAAELCLTPWAPAASVFKLVTSAALLEEGVKPSEKVCYHDGIHSIEASNLKADPHLDKACASFAYGLAKSQNALIARLVLDNLSPSMVSAMARLFGFGEKLPIELPSSPSQANVPSDALPFARVSAGFWQTTLSPLHGAWLAATIARGGTTPPLHMVSKIMEQDGGSEVAPAPASKRVLDESLAKTLARMMVGTTEFGTASRSFRDKDGKPTLRGVSVAGKTGTLTRREGGYLLYSWFVGFAPAKNPKVAFAVLLGNGPDRYVRAHQVARDILGNYFRSPDHDVLAER